MIGENKTADQFSKEQLAELTKRITAETVWQIAQVRRDGTTMIPSVFADIYGERYVAIRMAMKLNANDAANRYFVIERSMESAKFAYDGLTMPQEVEDEW